nr:MAG TPA: hypothetical protein [Bacteriophage sp.]
MLNSTNNDVLASEPSPIRSSAAVIFHCIIT